MKKSIIVAFIALVVGCAALIWIGSATTGHASRQAAAQLQELAEVDLPALEKSKELEPEDIAYFYNVLDDFYHKQDPRRLVAAEGDAPGSGMGMLHLACLFKKTELVRCLLLDGADANAHDRQVDSPLLMAVSTWENPQVTTEQINELVDTLLAGGAEFGKSGHNAGDFLTTAALMCENEDVILHLMEKGAQPDDDTAMPLALHGWRRALEATLRLQPNTDGLLLAVAKGVCSFEGSFAETLQLLLEHGAEVNASEPDMPGCTALFVLARELSAMDENAPHRRQAVEMLAQLLQHGADAYLRAEEDSEHPGFCPYDFLAMNPDVLEELRALGVELAAPPLRFTHGEALLAEVCRAAMMHHPAELLAPHYERIAAVLSPTPAMERSEMYPRALIAAVDLLAGVDAARAARSIQEMPLWRQPVPPAQGEDAEDTMAALVSALQDHPHVALEKGFICPQAERLLQAGRADEAAGLVELLARCPDAQEEIERYCAETRLPLQAGGYAAKLYAEGLPDARNNGVAAWLLERHAQADTPFLCKAVLLTSLEKLWYGQMSAEEQQQMLEAMRQVGAPTAAATYEKIIRCLDKPEELDTLMAQGCDWKYELETATARFFLAHKDEFLTTPRP